MWFDGQRQPNTIYVANTSRGKDSTAMLRAIQLMGWPLDAIVSVDIWATKDIPAELPPMVKFKDEYDQKVLDWFGVPVTRLCAVKREREREREREKRSDCPTNHCSISHASANDGKDISTDSLRTELEVGANSLKTKQAVEPNLRLTYEDIFYRQISPKRERERERSNQAASNAKTSELTDGLSKTEHGAIRLSNGRRCRIPEYRMPLVQRRTQTVSNYGFPIMGGNWCTYLKTAPWKAPE